MADEMKRINIYISEDLLKEARHLALDLEISFSEMMRQALSDYMEKARKKKD